MDDEWAPMTMAAEVIREQCIDRRRWIAVRKRHAQEASRLVDHEQEVIFEKDLQLAELEWSGATLRAARPVHPDTDDVPLAQTPRRVWQPHLDIVEEHLAALERRCDALARPEPVG
jgi:hypothetical protein